MNFFFLSLSVRVLYVCVGWGGHYFLDGLFAVVGGLEGVKVIKIASTVKDGFKVKTQTNVINRTCPFSLHPDVFNLNVS